MNRTRSTGENGGVSGWTPKNRGFASASSFATEPMRSAATKRGIAEMRLLTRWPDIVGPRLARLTRPLRVKYDRSGAGLGGVLILAVEGPRASEVEYETGRIIEQVNAYYGYRAIVDVRLTQAEIARPETKAARRRRQAADPDGLPDAKKRALAELTQPIGDDALRDALNRLGANVMSRKGSASSKKSMS